MRPRFGIVLPLVILIVFSCSKDPVDIDSHRGNLIIIGGGRRPASIMQKFVELANDAENPKILVLPMASSIPLEVGPAQAGEIRKLGGKNVRFLHFSKEQASLDSILQKFEGVTGIFISGGVQSRFMEVIKGTAIEAKIKELYWNGAVIAGTSAGAAVQSKMMITGDENFALSEKAPFSRIVANNIVTEQGIGLIEDIIVDQHFIARRRNNRLLSLVIENPKLIGFGIDESTAIWVKSDKSIEVLGERSIIIYDVFSSKTSSFSINEPTFLEAKDIALHVLRPGAVYDLKKRKVISLSTE